jgi:hypothetical protein
MSKKKIDWPDYNFEDEDFPDLPWWAKWIGGIAAVVLFFSLIYWVS